jgi:tetratricopeptide (TPR) repeat protein
MTIDQILKRVGAVFVFFGLWAAVPCTAAGQETSAQPEKDKPTSSAKAALEARLQALEEEERALEEMVARAQEGKTIDAITLFSLWLPPAVYLVDLPGAEERPTVTEAAAEITTDLLKNKESEMRKLEALKSKLERGEGIEIAEVVDLSVLGKAGREQELQKSEAEVEALRSRLSELQFQSRFQRAADLDVALEDQEDSVPWPDRILDPADFPTVQELQDKEPLSDGVVPNQEVEAEPIPDDTDGELKMAVDLTALADTCYRASLYEKALQVYEKIDIASQGQGDRILYMIGRCKERLGLLEEALTSYEQLEKVFPDSYWAKESLFAKSMVTWKIQLGAVQGTPPEARRLLAGIHTPEQKAEGEKR